EEARSAEDDGGDRRQRVAGALAGVADAELRKKDHGAQEGQERCTDIADQGSAVDRYADAPSGFLVRSDGAEPHAELRTPETELESDRSHDERDERDRNRPDLRFDRIRHRGGDVAVGRRSESERQASETDVRHERGRDGCESCEPDERTRSEERRVGKKWRGRAEAYM